jgi:predicted alpha/beta-fold hydrolase
MASAIMNYQAPLWLPGGNLQTIWPAMFARRSAAGAPLYRRERWDTPDADFIDVDWLDSAAPATVAMAQQQALIVMFHGLEGSSASHYAQAFADFADSRGAAFAVAHFRGCSGELNRGPRAYHSGDFQEIDWILRHFRAVHAGPVVAVGVSLGGNALMRWAGEMGAEAANVLASVASVSAPLDLTAGGHAIGRGFNRLIYTRMFLNTMRPKALRKYAQHPGLFDRDALMRAQDLFEFDNIFTAPVHGFRDTEDYWGRASAKPHLTQIGVPALLVNALNDPFVPAWSLPGPKDVANCVTLWQPPGGGHVGFAQGRPPGDVRAMPLAVGEWLLSHAR